jgi:hypothetical protein
LAGLGLMFRLCGLDWVITLGPNPPKSAHCPPLPMKIRITSELTN